MFSEDLRLAAVAMIERGSTRQKVCDVIGCQRAALARWLRNYRATGTIWPTPERRNSHADGLQFNEELHRAMVWLIDQDPTATLKDNVRVLDELGILAEDEFAGLQCSTASLSRYFRRMGFTRKVIERLFQERNEAARLHHCQLMRQIPRRCIISVDETHTDGGDVFLKRGWAPRHEPMRMLDRDPRSVPRTSTTMAISGLGNIEAVHTCVLGPALTAADWLIFCQTLVPQMNVFLEGHPWDDQPDNCILLFDNAPIHDAAGDAFLEANGVHFIRLPPYSPDLQPIEGVFNDLKCYIRRLVHDDPTLLDHPLHLQALAAVLITERQISGQFHRVEKVIESICE